jgi:hypothetical protein
VNREVFAAYGPPGQSDHENASVIHIHRRWNIRRLLGQGYQVAGEDHGPERRKQDWPGFPAVPS